MSDQRLTGEDGTVYSHENMLTQQWLNGHEAGLDMAVVYLKELAVDHFRHGQDDRAKELRGLADTMYKALREEMRERASNHAKEFPTIIADPNADI